MKLIPKIRDLKCLSLLILLLLPRLVFSQSTENSTEEKEQVKSTEIVSNYNSKKYPNGEQRIYFYINGDFDQKLLIKIEKVFNQKDEIVSISIFDKDQVKNKYRVTIKATGENINEKWVSSNLIEIINSKEN